MPSPLFPWQVRGGYCPLTITSEALEYQTFLVRATGEIDMATAPILAHELATVLRPPVPKIVLVDLSGVTFLDSTGIGVLIDVHKLARASAAHLRICGANRAVTRALQLTGVTNVLEIFDSRTAARLTSSPAGLPKQARRRFRGGPTQPGPAAQPEAFVVPS